MLGTISSIEPPRVVIDSLITTHPTTGVLFEYEVTEQRYEQGDKLIGLEIGQKYVSIFRMVHFNSCEQQVILNGETYIRYVQLGEYNSPWMPYRDFWNLNHSEKLLYVWEGYVLPEKDLQDLSFESMHRNDVLYFCLNCKLALIEGIHNLNFTEINHEIFRNTITYQLKVDSIEVKVSCTLEKVIKFSELMFTVEYDASEYVTYEIFNIKFIDLADRLNNIFEAVYDGE